MPLGGYCETCGRWVWVNAYGECENGHPASVVRDVQQLSPQTTDLSVPGELYRRRALELRRRHWWWRYSLWIVWTFVLGLNWVGYFYIGVRARKAEWIVSGLVYLIAVVVGIGLVGAGYFWIALAAVALAQGVSVLQAFLVRPQFRALMFGDAPAGTLPAPPPLLPKAERAALPAGVDAGVAQVIESATKRVDEIMETAQGITRPEVRDRVARLCVTAEKILAELRKEPRQIDLARAFLTYYLEAAHRIVRGYVGLATRDVPSPDVQETLQRAESSLDAIQTAFDKQLEGLLQHEVIDLDSEVVLLEKTVQMDGLMSSTPPGDISTTAPGGIPGTTTGGST
jgi:hypothetical protein